jgi:hypothetical protein
MMLLPVQLLLVLLATTALGQEALQPSLRGTSSDFTLTVYKAGSCGGSVAGVYSGDFNRCAYWLRVCACIRVCRLCLRLYLYLRRCRMYSACVCGCTRDARPQCCLLPRLQDRRYTSHQLCRHRG